jgi:hypothetical protein
MVNRTLYLRQSTSRSHGEFKYNRPFFKVVVDVPLILDDQTMGEMGCNHLGCSHLESFYHCGTKSTSASIYIRGRYVHSLSRHVRLRHHIRSFHSDGYDRAGLAPKTAI